MRNHPRKRSSIYVDLAFAAALGLMLLGAVVTLLWGADKSLGLADEGLYLLAARYPEEIQQHVSSVYVYTGFLFRAVDFSPTAFRLSGVLLICASAAVLWFGFTRFLLSLHSRVQRSHYFLPSSFFFIELGALLQYQWFYLSPNYNTLIAVAVYLCAGGILWGFSNIQNWEKKKETVALPFGLTGLSTGLAFFTKFPTGIVLLTIAILVVSFWSGINLRQRTTLLSALPPASE